MITLNVGRKQFLDWYIDEYTKETILGLLFEKGIVRIEDLVKDIGYLPLNLIANSGDIRAEDIDCEEIEAPTERYKIKLV